MIRPVEIRNVGIHVLRYPVEQELSVRWTPIDLAASVAKACRVTPWLPAGLWDVEEMRTVSRTRNAIMQQRSVFPCAHQVHVFLGPSARPRTTRSCVPADLPCRVMVTAFAKKVGGRQHKKQEGLH